MLQSNASRALLSNEVLRASGSAIIASTLTITVAWTGTLATAQIPLLFAGAAAVTIVAGPVVVRLIDEAGPRASAIIFKLVHGLATVAIAFLVSNVWALAFSIAAYVVADAASGAAVGTLIAHVLRGADRVQIRALLRSAGNVASSAALVVSALAIAAHNLLLLRCTVGIAGMLLISSVIPIARVTSEASADSADARPIARKRSLSALADPDLIRLIIANVTLDLGQWILTIAVPLLIVTQTQLPAFVYPVLLGANTVTITLLQPIIAKSAATYAGARRDLVRGLAILAVAVEATVLAGHVGAVAGLVMLVSAVAFITASELFHQSGIWGLSYAMAPLADQSAYQTWLVTFSRLSGVINPVLISAVLLPGNLLVAHILMLVVAVGLVAVLGMRTAGPEHLSVSNNGSREK